MIYQKIFCLFNLKISSRISFFVHIHQTPATVIFHILPLQHFSKTQSVSVARVGEAVSLFDQILFGTIFKFVLFQNTVHNQPNSKASSLSNFHILITLRWHGFFKLFKSIENSELYSRSYRESYYLPILFYKIG